MSSSQFDSWLATEVAKDALEEAQAEAWQQFRGQEARDDDARLHADPAYHAWVDAQALEHAVAMRAEAP
jgi:hypothetical protein